MNIIERLTAEEKRIIEVTVRKLLIDGCFTVLRLAKELEISERHCYRYLKKHNIKPKSLGF